MAKKKNHHEEHENLERWLVSYADFITLLFATFVVLYALSQVDLAKFKDLQISLKKAFAAPSLIQGDTGILDKSGNSMLNDSGQTKTDSFMPPLLDTAGVKQEQTNFEEVKKTLNEMSDPKDIQKNLNADINERGLKVNIIDSIIFTSGSAQIKKSSFPLLTKIGSILKSKFPDHLIRVEGHTDNIPVKSPLYPSNWELSSARSSSIVRYLIQNLGFDKTKFSAVGYADSRPVAPNSTEEGKIKNRRVEIVVIRKNSTESRYNEQGLDKKELNKIRQEAEKNNPLANNNNSFNAAVKNLVKNSSSPEKKFIFFQDPYQKESERLAKELKEKEQKYGNLGH